MLTEIGILLGFFFGKRIKRILKTKYPIIELITQYSHLPRVWNQHYSILYLLPTEIKNRTHENIFSTKYFHATSRAYLLEIHSAYCLYLQISSDFFDYIPIKRSLETFHTAKLKFWNIITRTGRDLHISSHDANFKLTLRIPLDKLVLYRWRQECGHMTFDRNTF